MNWLHWLNALDPLAFMVYVMSPPLLIAAAYASWIVWRDSHRPDGPRHHPAE